ncbi:MAG TPA: prenyltransferase/squalene oxidase repeat-containing protein [Tepidisphaeraceae bacterium]|jgi:squalene-hopene/tetraprenyl-beta-curcumene cyclase
MKNWFPIVLVTLILAPVALAQDATAQAQQLIDKGLNFLKTQQQPDGGWQQANQPPGVTAIVLRAFVRDQKYNAKTDFIKRGYDKLFSYQTEQGGIYKDLLANYNTSIAISAIAAANEPTFKDRLDRATAFVKGLQWTESATGAEGKKVDKSDPRFGGWGYGRHERPDLSNAHFAMEALHDAGLSKDDPAYQAAVVFLSRTQNSSETNDLPWATDDGGFVYTPAGDGDSEAGMEVGPDGKKHPRSYGSMTYAGLKSMIYAGLSKEDPRVKAAIDWIRRNWTLEENPGMGAADAGKSGHGLYYYYYVFAHALHAYGEHVIIDAKGATHDWRRELIAKLASLQKPDGSWAGEKRWMEDNPVLVTAYTVLALQEAGADLRMK